MKKRKLVYHWRDQLFNVGEIVEILNSRGCWKYPPSAEIVRIVKNRYGRISYKVHPPATDEKGKTHDLMLLEELLPRDSCVTR